MKPARRKSEGGGRPLGVAIFLIAFGIVAALSGRFLGRYEELGEGEGPEPDSLFHFALDGVLFAVGGLFLALGVIIVVAAGSRR